jgi:class 3 adenylate cyclase
MTAAQKFYMWLEGVNFAATLYDTNDLSVVRGSSMVLETLADVADKAFETAGIKDVKKVRAGAATAVFEFTTNEAQKAGLEQAIKAALAEGIWRHMSVVFAVAESIEHAQAHVRSGQFRQWTFPAFAQGGAVRPDRLDRVRPAIHQEKQGGKGWISHSVYDRLEYGRTQRRAFFDDRFTGGALKDVERCHSFEDLIKDAPKEVAESARSKIAVVHLDGDGFGKLVEHVGATEFNRQMAEILERVLSQCVDHALSAERKEVPQAKERLRLEVLVWGGDDITLVMPSWRILGFFEAFYRAIKSERINGKALGFTGGAVIAHYKSPVRQMVRLACDAVDLGKSGTFDIGDGKTVDGRNAYSIDIFESAALPEDGLAAHRKRVFSADLSPVQLAFPARQDFPLTDALREWQNGAGDDFPSRSKIHSVLSGAREQGLMTDAAQEKIKKDLGLYTERVLQTSDVKAGMHADGWRLPAIDHVTRPYALELALVTMLWDYVCVPTGGENDAAD